MTDTIVSENSPEHAPPSVGQILKTSRLAQGLTLEQVSKSLFISKRQLSYLEEDAEHLSCDVYTLGFVKLYSHYLNLDEQEIVEKFKKQNVDHPGSSQTIFPAPLPGRGIPSFWIIALSLSVLVTIIIGWKMVSHYTSSPAPLPIEAKLPDLPMAEETPPVEDASSDLESINLILKTGRLEGEYPVFGEKIFPALEKFLEYSPESD